MSWKNKKRLALCDNNRHYFAYDGRPIWLSGHSKLWTLTGFIVAEAYEKAGAKPEEDSDQVYSDRSYVQEVERVAESGGRLFRMTPFWPEAWKYGQPMPWKQVEPGRFDLMQWDEAHFEALSEFFALCAERDIIVQFEIWDRPGLSHWHPSRWPAHPMNPDHNINYGEDVLPGSDGGGNIVWGERLFYATARGENPELLKHQRTYVEKLLEVSGPYPNVIYCIENEGTGGIEWETLWAHVIRETVPDALVTAMPLDPDDHAWRAYFDDPNFNCLDGGGTALRYATLDVVGEAADLDDDVGRLSYDRIVMVRESMARYYLLMAYEPEKTRPVYVSNCFARVLDNIWAMFCSGAAGLRYHRVTWDETEESYRWVRAFNNFLAETAVPFADMAPSNHLLRGHGLCLANGNVAVVYLPTEREVTLAVPDSVDRVRVRLFDCDQGKWFSDETVPPEQATGAGTGLVVTLQAKTNTSTAAYVEFIHWL